MQRVTMNQDTIGRVFILESPNALDLLEGRGERSSIEQVCKLFEHDTTAFLLRDSAELKQTLMYLSSIGEKKEAGDAPLFIHISAHGNSEEIVVGPDHVPWKDLADMISEAYENLNQYKGRIILILSACGANEQKLTKFIKQKYHKREIQSPPEYIFVFSTDSVPWADAVVTWTIFYRKAVKLRFETESKKEVQNFLTRLRKSGFGSLTYFRWDQESSKYLRYGRTISRPASTMCAATAIGR